MRGFVVVWLCGYPPTNSHDQRRDTVDLVNRGFLVDTNLLVPSVLAFDVPSHPREDRIPAVRQLLRLDDLEELIDRLGQLESLRRINHGHAFALEIQRHL